MKNNRVVTKVAVYVVLIVISLILLVPLFILFSTALRSYDDLINYPSKVVPTQITFSSFVTVFKDNPFFLYLGNTIYITVMNIIGICFTSAMVAYGFVRFKVKCAGLIFGVFLSGMLIPGQVLTIPMFEVYSKFKWINTFLPFIVPAFFGGGIFNVFLQRQFMRGLQNSLFDAAEVDGCNELQIFLLIVLPLIKPVIITIAVFTFQGSWNDLFGPLIYLDEPEKWTLAKANYMLFQAEMGKMGITGGSILPWNIISAANVVVILPIIILYFFAQKVFIEGIVTTGMKD